MVTGSLKRKWARLRCNYLRMSVGISTPFEFFLHAIGEACGLAGIQYIRQNLANSVLLKRRKKMYLTRDCYALKEVKIPLLAVRDEKNFLVSVLEDTFYSYLHLEDNYDVNDVKFIDDIIPEGFYIYCNKALGINFKLRPNDVVIDAGAWIGDFSAYASVCEARAYAFEPVSETFEILKETARLNKNISPVNMGLGAKKEELVISVKGSSSSFNIAARAGSRRKTVKIQVTTLDDFVEENKLERVDFIKADIEGHERFMLKGAQNVLKRFGPRLAICTYHLPDDPQVLASTIKEANDAYTVIQGRKKLFAYIPDISL